MELSRYPIAVRCHCYRNERTSGPLLTDPAIKGSASEKAVLKERRNR